jgi:spermidine/putrescine transport system permease protein
MASSMESRAPGSTRRAARAWGFLLPALVWTLAFFAAPLVIMLVYSLWQRSGVKLVKDFTTANYEKFFAKSFFFDSLVNSIEVTVIVTLISILLAYPLAYILAEKVPPRWQRIALLLAILPFWTCSTSGSPPNRSPSPTPGAPRWSASSISSSCC